MNRPPLQARCSRAVAVLGAMARVSQSGLSPTVRKGWPIIRPPRADSLAPGLLPRAAEVRRAGRPRDRYAAARRGWTVWSWAAIRNAVGPTPCRALNARVNELRLE